MLQSGSKSLYHHVDYGRDNCHWLHRKRKLRYTPRNPPPRFLCLELLCLSTWQLYLHQLSSVSSPFIIGGRLLSQAFTPPQIGASTTTLFPSLHALERSSPVVFIKSTKDFLLYTTFTQSLLWASSENSSSPCTCCLISVPRWITSTPAQSPCALVQFLFSRFLPIPCLCLTAAHPVTTPVQVKIGCQSLSPCCISLPLSGFSSILPWEITVTKANFFGEITTPSDPWTYGTQLFPSAVILLVFNYFITDCYMYENSTVWILLQLSKFPGKIRGVTLVPLKTQSPRQNFLRHIYPSYCLSVYTTIC